MSSIRVRLIAIPVCCQVWLQEQLADSWELKAVTTDETRPVSMSFDRELEM